MYNQFLGVQIMQVFARGADDSTFVKVTIPNGSKRSISLRQLSRFDEAVHKEVYVGLIHQILREMPLVSPLQSSPIYQAVFFPSIMRQTLRPIWQVYTLPAPWPAYLLNFQAPDDAPKMSKISCCLQGLIQRRDFKEGTMLATIIQSRTCSV